MEDNITVICVLWKGKFKAHKYDNPNYDERWVERLGNMVRRRLNVPHEFVCLSNTDIRVPGCRVISLKHNLPGWWSKLEIFREYLPIRQGKVLYLDLDVIIVGDLMPLLQYDNDITICDTFVREDEKDIRGLHRGYNSSVMVFKHPTKARIFKKFIKRKDYWMMKYRGDQDYLKAMFPRFGKFPQGWIKKLGMCKDGKDSIVVDNNMKVMLCMPEKNIQAAHRYPLVHELWQ